MLGRTALAFLFTTVTAVSVSGAAPLQLKNNQGLPPSHGQTFPTLSDPHPFRQGALVTCNTDQSCILPFDKIAANRLLQIDTISCADSGGLGFLFRNKTIVEDADHMIGVFQQGSSGGSVSGPFYVASGEQPTIYVTSTNAAFCSIFGTLWTTG